MDHLKSATINRHRHHHHNQDQQHPMFESAIDLMDFSMFPPDHSLLNSTHLTGDNDNILKNTGSTANTELLGASSNIPDVNSSNQFFLNSFTSSNDFFKNSHESTMFNSDDLMFSQHAAAAAAAVTSLPSYKSNGLFNNDIYFVNGLLTPPDSDNHDVYSLTSRASSSALNTNNVDFNHQILNFTRDSSYEDVDYFSSSIEHLNILNNLKNQRLSSPLHSPKSEDFQPHFTTTKRTNQLLPKQEHNAKKKRVPLNGSSSSVSIPKVQTNGVYKPPATKRSKTLNDLSAPPVSTLPSPSPIDYNPAVPNEVQWFGVSPITDARFKEVLQLAGGRKLDKKKVAKILNSFRQKHILTKLNIIDRKISSRSAVDEKAKLARLSVMETPNSFKVICHTSSGYDAPVQEHEAIPNGLRKLNILKDHVNYKLYGETSKDDKIKRPLNQFMLYKKAMIKAADIFKVLELIKENRLDELIKLNEELKLNPSSSVLDEILDAQPKLDHHLTCHVISLLWVTESEQVKEQFANFAKLEKDVHAKVYPNYKFNPQKRNSTSK